MKKQQGVALSGLLMWSFILVIGAIFGMKIVPATIEYFKIKKAAESVVAKAGSNATVPELRAAFDRQMQIDNLEFSSKDLDIHKNTRGAVVISVDYEKRIPLFANVSLVIDYKASTAE
ncbi:DUF4845 domain-containing protein [Azonexus sp.]|uniref:DUF4845 domain-containing protein n=1 Tax=Azonexus sp. TaxID=1872668 RepID=UPI0039E56439